MKCITCDAPVCSETCGHFPPPAIKVGTDQLFIELLKISEEFLVYTTEYSDSEDEVGSCIHCGKVSYIGHLDDCPVSKLRAFISRLS